MNPTPHPSNTRLLHAPTDWDQQAAPCDSLPVSDVEAHGMKAVVSFWKPTPEELQQLAEGGLVSLWIFGTTMPAVAVSVEDAP